MLPKRRFWNVENIRARHFVSTFHTPDYFIWAKRDENCLQNVVPEYFRRSKIFVWGGYT